MTDLAELSEKVTAAVTAAQRQILDTARSMLNEAGLPTARRALIDSIDGLERAQDAVRDAVEAKRTAQQAHDDAYANAINEANLVNVTREGNKTFWGDGDDRRQVTADEARDLARQYATAATEAQRRALDHFDAQLAAARDALDVAKTRISVTRAEVAAAVAHVQLFAGALAEIGETQR